MLDIQKYIIINSILKCAEFFSKFCGKRHCFLTVYTHIISQVVTKVNADVPV